MKNIKYKRPLLTFIILLIIASISLVIVVGDDETGFGAGFFTSGIVTISKYLFIAIVLPGKTIFGEFNSLGSLIYTLAFGCVMHTFMTELIAMAINKLSRAEHP